MGNMALHLLYIKLDITKNYNKNAINQDYL